MKWAKLFFSFRGRVSTAGYWLVSLTWFVLAIVLYSFWPASGMLGVPIGADHPVDAVYLLAAVPLLASGFAVIVKRLHDRNKSAWWLLLFLVCPPVMEAVASIDALDAALTVILMILSIAISLWAFIELGFASGTAGANRYGPEPSDGAAAVGDVRMEPRPRPGDDLMF
jgi:uncharacterized membrane protein YhaH (DUF805 family)